MRNVSAEHPADITETFWGPPKITVLQIMFKHWNCFKWIAESYERKKNDTLETLGVNSEVIVKYLSNEQNFRHLSDP